ncbi:MAG: RluA family pseudouridine synthase [Victivallales bacterium]|nr:RluA family pseudouridine synthase [Victivallales bacterium]
MSHEFVTLTIPLDVVPGQRLDKYLAKMLPEYSRAYFQRAIQDGFLLVDGEKVEKSDLIRPGATVTVDVTPSVVRQLEPEEIPLDVLYEDDDLIVVNKQPGLVVHPANGNWNGTLVNALLNHCDSDEFEEMIDDDLRPGIVHRLDKDTSGALIIAKNQEIREKFKEAFINHEVRKVYAALILGKMNAANGKIELPIGRHPYNFQKMAVVMDRGKEASTQYKTIAFSNGVSLVKILLHTGRTHQIRVHFAHFGHPVLGDALYGGRPQQSPYAAARQMLHAYEITFAHPRSGKKLKITAPLSEDFIEALRALKLPLPTGARAL